MPDVSAVLYRLFRLRRLWVLCVLFPLVGAALGALIGGPDGLLHAPDVIAAIALAGAAVFAVLLVTYPAGHIDALALSIATALTLAVLPAFEAGTEPATGPLDMAGRLLLLLALWAVLALAALMCLAIASTMPGRPRVIRSRHVTRLTPEAAFEALVLRPETRSALRETGPEGAQGMFEVTTWIGPVGRSEDPAQSIPVRMHAVVLESGRWWQVTLLVGPCGSTSVNRQNFTPVKGGTLCEVEEVQEHLNCLSCVLFWLADYGADHICAEIDAALDRPTRAICRAPQYTLLSDLERLLIVTNAPG